MWIVVEDGNIFEGDESMWADCFFSNADAGVIIDFCDSQGWKVKITDVKPENTTA
jgi:hypothetical protein